MFGHDDTNQQANTFGAAAPDPVQNTTDTPLPAPAPSSPYSDPLLPPKEVPAPDTTSSAPLAPTTNTSDDLLDIKQQALQELTPLVGHLDQTPEEKFRTTMMMIQAADNQSLIKSAYEAAKEISDEKARAQALLDVVNEINYFTQQHNS